MITESSAPLTESGAGVQETGFFGQPRGLATLFFAEMWERFSYYGMRALLVLFMTASVANGGLGFDVKTAGAVYGMYTALVYMTGVPGGWLADNFIGQRWAVLSGGVIIMAGHICLAMHGMTFFYSGLALIIVGTGLLKPNMSTMVGLLYRADDNRRDAGFSIYYMGVNFGAGISPLICGFLAQSESFKALLRGWGMHPENSWHWGFAAAAVGMGFGLVQFVLGDKYLGQVGLKPVPSADLAVRKTRQRMLQFGLGGTATIAAFIAALAISGTITLSVVTVSDVLGVVLLLIPIIYFPILILTGGFDSVERKRILVIMILFIFAVLFWSAFEQAGSSLTLFADRFTRNSVFGYEFPSTWWQVVNAAFIILLAPVFGWLWLKLGNKEPSSPAKFAYGLFFVGLGFAAVALAAFFSGPEGLRVNPSWLVAVYLLHTIGELCVSPVGLSMVTKLAPLRSVSQMMGIWFLATSLGNFVGGRIAGQFESFPLPQLFGAIFATTCGAALLLAILARPIRRLMGGVH